MDVALERAAPAEAAILQNLLQLYTHDFTEFWDGGVLGPDGRFQDYALATYFERPGWEALLIRAQGAPAGFALVNDQPHSGLPADRSVAEFFVARPYRRQGLGQRAAHALFGAAPGLWEVAVARRNIPAQAFWRRAIDAAARDWVETFDLAGPDWNGPVFRFRIA